MSNQSEFDRGLRTARAVNAAGEAGDATGRFVGPAALLPEEGWADQSEDFAAFVSAMNGSQFDCVEDDQAMNAMAREEIEYDAEAIRRAVAAGSCDQREIIDAQDWRCWCGRTNPVESVWCIHEEAGD